MFRAKFLMRNGKLANDGREFMKKQQTTKSSKAKTETPQPTKGPEPERLKIEGDWVKAVDHSLTVKRPPEGWPK